METTPEYIEDVEFMRVVCSVPLIIPNVKEFLNQTRIKGHIEHNISPYINDAIQQRLKGLKLIYGTSFYAIYTPTANILIKDNISSQKAKQQNLPFRLHVALPGQYLPISNSANPNYKILRHCVIERLDQNYPMLHTGDNTSYINTIPREQAFSFLALLCYREAMNYQIFSKIWDNYTPQAKQFLYQALVSLVAPVALNHNEQLIANFDPFYAKFDPTEPDWLLYEDSLILTLLKRIAPHFKQINTETPGTETKIPEADLDALVCKLTEVLLSEMNIFLALLLCPDPTDNSSYAVPKRYESWLKIRNETDKLTRFHKRVSADLSGLSSYTSEERCALFLYYVKCQLNPTYMLENIETCVRPCSRTTFNISDCDTIAEDYMGLYNQMKRYFNQHLSDSENMYHSLIYNNRSINREKPHIDNNHDNVDQNGSNVTNDRLDMDQSFFLNIQQHAIRKDTEVPKCYYFDHKFIIFVTLLEFIYPFIDNTSMCATVPKYMPPCFYKSDTKEPILLTIEPVLHDGDDRETPIENNLDWTIILEFNLCLLHNRKDIASINKYSQPDYRYLRQCNIVEKLHSHVQKLRDQHNIK